MPQDLKINVDFNTAVTLDGTLRAARAFLRWWTDQLVSLLPTKWRDSLRSWFGVSRLVIAGDEWSLEFGGGNMLRLDGRRSAHEIREKLQEIFPHVFDRSVEVVVPQSDVLLRRILLPAAAGKRLRSVIRLQLDRLSPFRGDDVQFDCVEIGSTGGNGGAAQELPVVVAIMAKNVLRDLELKVRAVGLVPKIFLVPDSILSFSPAGLPWTKLRQTQTMMAVAGGLLWLAAIWFAPIVHKAEIRSLTSEIETLAPRVRHALAVREELSGYQLPHEALSAHRASVLEILADLTRRLPRDVHLTRLQLSDEHLALYGNASDSAAVANALKQSPLLNHVERASGRNDGKAFALQMRLPRNK